MNKCRELRIPYIFTKDTLPTDFYINNIILPITNLKEEREKGPFASSFARHFNCHIAIYQPNDYGSKAIANIDAMKTLFDSFELSYSTTKGKKDSNNIEFETSIAIIISAPLISCSLSLAPICGRDNPIAKKKNPIENSVKRTHTLLFE